MNDHPDPEFWAMRLMSVDELARYGDILDAISEEEAFCNELSKANPNQILTDKERQEWMAHMGRWEREMSDQRDMIQRLVAQVPAWEKLATMACVAMESLVAEGTTPNKSGGKTEFFNLVYHRILKNSGHEISRDPDFKQVQINQFLQKMLVIRLPEFAAQYRNGGNPILAQIMEELAEDN